MFTSVNIQGFRGFETLSVDRLAKVNVLIGANNAGKTALLEAVELLGRGPEPTALVELLQRREEYALGSGPSRFPFDPRSLFYGRSPTIGTSFRLSAQGEANERDATYECSLQALEEEERTVLQVQLALAQPSDVETLSEPHGLLDDGLSPLALEIQFGQQRVRVPLSQRYLPRARMDTRQPTKVQFLGTSLFSAGDTAALWEQIALTDKEDDVIRTLRVIEPSVQRIAVLGGQNRRVSVYLQLAGEKGRVPLGNMGEGIRRLFSLALAIGNTPRHGTLVVDEIDAGLHHSTMAKMWELVLTSARRIPFQAFVTTHSLDCLLALARVIDRESSFLADVAVHRLERNRPITTLFTAKELLIAVNQELEIR